MDFVLDSFRWTYLISKTILLGFFQLKIMFFFLFCRPYVQVQSEARKEVMKNTSKSQAKKGFSYLEGQQTPATQPSNTPWKATLDQNVPGAQSNAEDFTQQFMQEMYGGTQAAVPASTNQQILPRGQVFNNCVLESRIFSLTLVTSPSPHRQLLQEKL